MREGREHYAEEEYQKELRDKQREIRERLFELDDLLAAAPDDLPYRDSVRGLLSAANRLTQESPFPDPHRTRELDIKDKISEALAPLGLEVQEAEQSPHKE